MAIAVRLGIVLSISLLVFGSAGLESAHAQDKDQPKDKAKLGWSNASDLSLVLTAGNSDSTTLGLSDKLGYRWKAARFDFDIDCPRHCPCELPKRDCGNQQQPSRFMDEALEAIEFVRKNTNGRQAEPTISKPLLVLSGTDQPIAEIVPDTSPSASARS